MEIRGTLRPEELLAAQWLHLRPRWSLGIVGIILIVLGVWFTWVSLFGEARSEIGWVGWVGLGGSLYLLLMFFVFIPYRSRRNYRQRKDLQREMVFVASDDGFTIQMENALVKKPWGDFLKWKEGKTLFLVYISDNVFQLVPKRFFSLPEDVTSFRNLLNAKVAAR